MILLWEGVVILKEQILDNFYFGRVWCGVMKGLILDNFHFGGITDFDNFLGGGCGGLERTDFVSFQFVRVW